MSLKVLGNRRYLPLFLTQFFGALNDNFFKNAIVVMITYQGMQVGGLEPEMVVALAGGLFILPYFLFSGTSGQLADKLEKSRLIRFTKAFEVVVMLTAVAGFYLEHLPLLLLALFLLGLQSTIFGPLKYGILPDLVREESLVAANAYVELGTFVAILVGTITGGLAVGLGDARVWVVAGVMAIALLGLLASFFVPAVPVHNPGLRVDWTFVRSTWQVVAAVRPNRPIFNSILGISWFWFLGAAILTLLPSMAKNTLHADESVVTTFLALFTLGVGGGSILCEKLSFRRVEVGVIPFGAVGMSLFMVDLWWAGSAWQAPAGSEMLPLAQFAAMPGGMRLLADLLLLAFSGGMFIVPLYSFIQKRGEPAVLSRIIAANNIINALFMVGASLIIMAFYRMGLGIPAIFGVFAVVNLLVAVYIYSLVPEFTLRFLGWIISRLMYRIRVEGAEHLPVDGPAVLVCNHVSYIDWLIIGAECKVPVRWVMDHRIFANSSMRLLLRHAKVTPIAPRKEDPALMERAFAKVSEDLKAGEVVGIFPEGMLTLDGRMNVFRPGVERILASDPAPVVPMALHGLWGSSFSRARGQGLKATLRRWRREVVLWVGPPIAPQEASAARQQEVVTHLLEQAVASAPAVWEAPTPTGEETRGTRPAPEEGDG